MASPAIAPGPPQIKICGITSARDAQACVAAGAAALGFVSYPRSPRHLGDQTMRRIIADLPKGICSVGVFVNEGFDRIMRTVATGCLKAVQLHGAEPPGLVEALAAEGLLVIKALFVNGQPALDAASRYPAAAFLVECAGGVLPGGNAMSWTWADARRISSGRPVVLAGGLTPANVQSAIAAANPDAVDVSSGVEESPGRKDITKVAAFCRAVSTCRTAEVRNVFNVTAGPH